MRVLLVCEACLAGTGRHLLDLCHGLISRGHSVCLVYSPLRMDSSFRSRLSNLPRESRIPLAMKTRPTPSDLMALLRLRGVIKKGNFDLLHGHSSKAGALLRMAAIGLHLPVLYTPHAMATMNSSFRPVQRYLIWLVEQVLSHLCHRIVAVSNGEANHLLAEGFSPRRITLIPNGGDAKVRLSRKEARTMLGLEDDALVIGFVGRLTLQKNPLLLMEAFSLLLKRYPTHHLHLMMIGEGELAPLLSTLAKVLGERVSLPGALDAEVVMSAFDILAIPSLYEGLPYVGIEALHCGLPIVMTQVGGADELIDEGGNGFITPVGDANAFSIALGKLVTDVDLRRSFGTNALHRSEAFSAAGMMDGLLALYQKVTL